MRTLSMATACSTILGLVTILHAAELTKRVVTKDGFTIVLPDGSTQMPLEMLDQMNQDLRQQLADPVNELSRKYPPSGGQGKVPAIDYAFRLPSAKPTLEDPYVFVFVDRSGWKSESHLPANAKVIARLEQEGADLVRKSPTASMVSDAKVGEAVFDQANHILWLTTRINRQNASPMEVISGERLTQYGAVRVNCYCDATLASEYKPLFEQIIRSIKSTKPSSTYLDRLVLCMD